jgi:hypothetical protein
MTMAEGNDIDVGLRNDVCGITEQAEGKKQAIRSGDGSIRRNQDAFICHKGVAAWLEMSSAEPHCNSNRESKKYCRRNNRNDEQPESQKNYSDAWSQPL